jgi:thioredoxin 1
MKMAVIDINKDNFQKEVIESDKPVLLDFWASWCGPCMMLSPVIEELATELEGKAKVGKINVDEEMELSMEFGIESIPTLMFFKNGEMVKKTIGLMTKKEIKDILENI